MSTPPNPKAGLTPEEQEIIEVLEKSRDRPMTAQEIYVSLQQARGIGQLP
jgi:Fe2+ or Zn2+ uptake regulation protein